MGARATWTYMIDKTIFWGVKWPVLLTSVSEEGWESIFYTALEELQRPVQNPWYWLTIFQGAAASVGNNLGGRGVCWKSQGGGLGFRWQRCSIPDGDLGIPDSCCRYFVGDHVGWYWLRSRGREMWRRERIIGLVPTPVADIWSGSISVWDILVGIGVSLWHWCPQLESWGGYALWKDGDT